MPQKGTARVAKLSKLKSTSLKEAMASTTSFVKALPTLEVPIKTVGLMDWSINEKRLEKYDEI